jgi:hypothetical protein
VIRSRNINANADAAKPNFGNFSFRRSLREAMGRLTPHALAFYEYVTPRTFAVAYFAIVIALLGVTLPILGVRKWNDKSQHQDAARQISAELSSMIEAQIVRMHSALKLLGGFAASGAPLQVPDYARDDSHSRAEVSTRTGTPNALSLDGYNRILGQVTSSYKGFLNAVVQPGLINVYAPNGSATANRDWLNYTPEYHKEYFYMVNYSVASIYGPVMSRIYNEVAIAVRVPVWSTMANLSSNTTDFDSATGWHVNWRNLWGAVTVVVGLQSMARQLDFESAVGPDYDYLFEALPRYTLIFPPSPHFFMANSTHPSNFKNTINDCVATKNYENLCFRVQPKTGKWRGSNLAVTLATAALLEIFVPFVFMCLAFLVARLLLGARPVPLRYAPIRIPFYAVCVDMVGAIKMWAEVPFIMNEVTTVFSQQLDTLAEEHQVFIALRLGNTVIAVSQRRNRVMQFAQTMSQWALNHKWPAHIAMHCEGGRVSFSFMLHRLSNIAVRVDPSTNYYEATGPDMQLLLLLRTAGIPWHLICTTQYVGLDESRPLIRASVLDGMPDGEAVPRTDQSSDVASVKVGQLLKFVREIGICEVPVDGRVVTTRGFLVPSASTGNRSLHEVIDSFPDWVWNEWRPLKKKDLESPSDAGNPLGQSFNTSISVTTGVTHTTRFIAKSSCTHSIASSVRIVSRAHLDNLEAAYSLPGSAVALGEARQVASVVANSAATKSATFSGDVSIRPEQLPLQSLRETVSLATYYFVAYRTVFAPIDPETTKMMVTRICAATGLLTADNYLLQLAARCARVSQQHLRRESPHACG